MTKKNTSKIGTSHTKPAPRTSAEAQRIIASADPEIVRIARAELAREKARKEGAAYVSSRLDRAADVEAALPFTEEEAKARLAELERESAALPPLRPVARVTGIKRTEASTELGFMTPEEAEEHLRRLEAEEAAHAKRGAK